MSRLLSGRQGRLTPVALGAILLLGLGVRAYRLDRESLWLDEVLSVSLATRSFPEMVKATAQDGHPPFYLGVLHLWIQLFGASETAVRSLSAGAGLASILAMSWAGRALYSARVGLVASLFLACSPYHVYYSQEARNYSFLVLLTLLSCGCLPAFLRKPQRACGLAHVACTALLLYTHVFGFLVWGAQLLYLAWGWRAMPFRRSELRTLLRLQACVAVVVPLWLLGPWAATLLRQTSTVSTGLQLAPPTLLNLATSFYQFAGSPIAAIALAPLAALEAYRGVRRALGAGPLGRDASGLTLGASWLLALWVAVPQLVPFAVSQVSVPVYITRATIVTLPAFLLLAAAHVARLRPAPRTLLLAAVVSACLGQQWLFFRFPSKEQWREAAAVVDQYASPGDAIAFDVGYGQLGFDHYSQRTDLARFALPSPLPEPKAVAALVAGAQTAPRVWLVRFHRPSAHEAVIAALADRYRPLARAHYVGIDLLLFVRKQ